MSRKNGMLALCLGIALATCLVTSEATAAAWNSFLPASFAGIQVAPALTGGTTAYELAVEPGAQIILGVDTYHVNWIQAYYVVGETSSTVFTATEGTTSTGWSWESKSAGGQIAGWHGTGGNRLYPGQTMSFTFAEFETPDGGVLSGIHVGYQVGVC